MLIETTMRLADRPKMADDEANGVTADHDIECGRQAAKEFNFAKEYRNLNHGMCIMISIPNVGGDYDVSIF